jgi:hypothetical protein
MLSPVDFEIRQQKLNETGVWETSGTSLNIDHNVPRVKGVSDDPIRQMPAPAAGQTKHLTARPDQLEQSAQKGIEL